MKTFYFEYQLLRSDITYNMTENLMIKEQQI